MTKTLTRAVAMEEIDCIYCGLPFIVPAWLRRARRQDKQSFWCPSCGKPMVYGESELDRLKKKLESADELAKSWMAEYDRERERHEQTEARRRALKGALTKAKKRSAAGTCPCCKRTFSNMAAHMKTKHPEFIDEQRPKATPP